MKKICLALLLCLFGAAGLAACGRGSSATMTTSAATAKDCLKQTTTASNDNAVVAVLPAIASGDTSGPIVEERMKTFSTVVDGGFKMKALLLGDVIGTGVGDADLAINTPLVGDGPNPLMRTNDAKCKREGLTEQFKALAMRRADGPLDILSALRTLDAHLTGLPKKDVSVVLMSSMLNTTPVLNLQDPATLAGGIETMVNSLKQKHVLPDCRGWHVYAIGGGRVPTGGLDGERNEQLQQFWSALFRACGGRLVVYDTHLASFPVKPVAGNALSPPAKGLVTVRNEGMKLVANVPSSVLFDVGRASLRPDADAALRKLLDDTVAQYPHATVSIVGYTDSTGTPDANLILSKQRAQAVAAWLIVNSVDARRITTDGRGEADPVADNNTPDGRQANRRVVVTVTS